MNRTETQPGGAALWRHKEEPGRDARPFRRQRLWEPLTRLLSVPSGLVSAVWGQGVGGLWADAMLEGRGDNFDSVSTDPLKLELPEVSWRPARAPAGCGGHSHATNAKSGV